MNTKTLLDRGVNTVLIRKNLEQRLKTGAKLRVKLGIDPTKPDLHLGHAVPLLKLKQFQDAGHHIILLFGGFTATIGDPTGKDDSRPPLTQAEVEENTKLYLAQAGKILDLNKTEVVNNKDWLGKLTPTNFVELLGQFTVHQMLERDMFQKRIQQKKPIFCHELLYPIMQGYDSVAIKADLEIGGNDQLFNLLAARPLQKNAGQKQQDVLTVPLIEGLDGKEKMSKSLDNYIGLNETPENIYGKIMKVPDHSMPKYFEVLTTEDLEKIAKFIKTDPRGAKGLLAKTITTLLHNQKEAERAEQDFINKFVKKSITITAPEAIILPNQSLIDVLKILSPEKTTSDLRRLIKQGGIKINGEKQENPNSIIVFQEGNILKIGKKTFFTLRNAL